MQNEAPANRNMHPRDTKALSPDLLPKWQSHKVVRGAKIHSIDADNILLLVPMRGPDGKPAEDMIASVRAADRMFDRYMPVPGDYYVVYDDGYASISPKKAFEEGYHRL